MRSFLRRLRASERVRFLIVGGFNTVFAYGLFVVFELTLGGRYLLSLGLSYAVATIVGFLTHRRLTFAVSGRHNLITDFFRFQGVHLLTLAINALLLPVFVEVIGWPAILSQAVIVAITTVVSYLGHKFFSFRRGSP
ncbi:GtrA family protein [Marisediminicola senii]|uniref:GtrA family protein n=1 Tax=Marisediminicola senii TaxID=2711233 RepID=UPI0013EADF39|nr:GtrA family protein [Marisediminicola senii]